MSDKGSAPEQERRVGFALMKQDLEHVKEGTEELLRILKGTNSTPGLMTKCALNSQSICRAWWFIGAICATVLGTVGWIIRGAVQ